MRIKIAPSILAADFDDLTSEVALVEKSGADMIHVDVMDGIFVPNKTRFRPDIIEKLKKSSKLPFDVHLMVRKPEEYIEDYMGFADILTVHVECISKNDFLSMKKMIGNKKLGIAINPPTPFEKLQGFLNASDMVLVMTVNPGFGGQTFMPRTLDRVKSLREIYHGDIEVDGGINAETARLVVNAGANILVAGTYVFKSENYREAIESLKRWSP